MCAKIVAPLGYLERSSTKPTLSTGVGSLSDFSQQIIQVALVVALRDNDFGAKVKGTVQSNSTVILVVSKFLSITNPVTKRHTVFIRLSAHPVGRKS